jgi:hypothetical protein
MNLLNHYIGDSSEKQAYYCARTVHECIVFDVLRIGFARIVTHLEAVVFGVGLRVPDSFNLQHTLSNEAENGTKESGRQAGPMNEMQRSFVTV